MNCPSRHLAYRMFYQLEKTSDKPEPLVTLFSHVGYYPRRQPPPIPHGTPVPDTLSELCCLMNKEARALLYARHEEARGKGKPQDRHFL